MELKECDCSAVDCDCDKVDPEEIKEDVKAAECGNCDGKNCCCEDQECYTNEHYIQVDSKLLHESKKNQKYNAPHRFEVTKQISDVESFKHLVVFQEGPIKEVGVNGVTNEDLLAMVAARLEAFQQSPFASDDNATALDHVYAALDALNIRTKKRMARGVEGTNQQ